MLVLVVEKIGVDQHVCWCYRLGFQKIEKMYQKGHFDGN